MKITNMRILPLVIATFLVAGAPYIKNSCDCADGNTVTLSAGAKAHAEEKKSDIKVTFIELGSMRCGPCRMMQPVVEQIKKDFQGQVNVIFYDVWSTEGRPYGEQYNIRLIPTQVFLDKNGREYFRHEGFFPREEIIEVLKRQGVR